MVKQIWSLNTRKGCIGASSVLNQTKQTIKENKEIKVQKNEGQAKQWVSYKKDV